MSFAIRQLGLYIRPLSVIHDSNQNKIKVVDLFYVAKAYYHFFREYEKDYIGVDFKYDLELMRNFRDHTTFNMDWEESIMELEGPEDDLNYYAGELSKKWELELIQESERVEQPSDDLYSDYSKDFHKRSHQYCMHPLIKRNCPWVYGRKYKVHHDWKSDPLFLKIDSLPLDMTMTPDRYIGNGENVSA